MVEFAGHVMRNNDWNVDSCVSWQRVALLPYWTHSLARRACIGNPFSSSVTARKRPVVTPLRPTLTAQDLAFYTGQEVPQGTSSHLYRQDAGFIEPREESSRPLSPKG